MVLILHSGQTGVERGAHRAAVVTGLPLAGFMPLGERDEFGRIPTEVAQHLTSCPERGPRQAVRANIAIATGIVVAVPERSKVARYTGMNTVLAVARASRVPWIAADPRTDLDDIAAWVRQLPTASGDAHLLVTGPRGTRWHEGETFAIRLVVHLA